MDELLLTKSPELRGFQGVMSKIWPVNGKVRLAIDLG